jgi:microcystin-dependent protein
MKKLILLLASLLSIQAFAAPISALVIPGTVISFAGASYPVGYIAGDGSSLLRAGKYAALFAASSTAYGAVDGTHFNLPDLRGKFIRGVNGGAANDPDAAARVACNTGGATGNNVGSCQSFQIQSHSHNYTPYNGNTQGGGGATGFVSTANSAVTTNTGGSETRPLNVYVLYCIKY